jgi:hypothetical protein
MGQIPIFLKKWSPGRADSGGFWVCLKSLVLRGWSAGAGLSGVFMIHKFKVLPILCITISHAFTLSPPAMGTHFSGLSLKKWSPGRAALK